MEEVVILYIGLAHSLLVGADPEPLGLRILRRTLVEDAVCRGRAAEMAMIG